MMTIAKDYLTAEDETKIARLILSIAPQSATVREVTLLMMAIKKLINELHDQVDMRTVRPCESGNEQ